MWVYRNFPHSHVALFHISKEYSKGTKRAFSEVDSAAWSFMFPKKKKKKKGVVPSEKGGNKGRL